MKTNLYFKQKRLIPKKFNYTHAEGSFGVMCSLIRRGKKHLHFSWYHCRDGYQSVAKSKIIKSGIFFSHNGNQSDQIALFLRKIENKLNLKIKSKFRKTNLKKILWIKISPWWLECFMRRSFLTLMLRLGMQYDPKAPENEETIETVAKRSLRGIDTLPAIKLFLNGYTVYTGTTALPSYRGWVEIFRNKNLKDVQTLLIKEKRKVKNATT